MRARITAFTLFACSLMGLAASGASAQVTLQSIKQRGTLICGSNVTIEGFGIVGPQGHWMGFDVDFCRYRSSDLQRSHQGPLYLT